MKKTILLFCLLTIFANAQFPSFDWAKKVGGKYSDRANSVITDSNGDVYLTGFFQDTVDFDPGIGTFTLASSFNDMFILKLTSSGSFIWAKQIGGFTGYVEPFSIAIDGNDNIHVTGYFQAISDFDPGPASYTLDASGLHEVFILKLDSSGAFIWAKQFEGFTFSVAYARDIFVQSNGDIYLTGEFSHNLDFDTGPGTYTLASVSGRSTFIVKLNSAGDLDWAREFTGTAESFGYSITLDALSNVYIVGSFVSSNSYVDFDPGPFTYTMTSASGRDVYISKLDSMGNFVWVKQFLGPLGHEEGFSIDIDAQANLYTTGYYAGPTDFDPGPATYTLPYSAVYNSFVSKLDSAGNFVWARKLGSFSCTVMGTSIYLDQANNIYTTGEFKSSPDFDPGAGTYSLNSFGETDVYLSKLDASGNFVFAAQLGGSGEDKGNQVYVNSTGDIYTVGFYSLNCDFDPTVNSFTLNSIGEVEAFIHKIGNCASIQPPQNLTPVSNLTICSNGSTTLTASANGVLNWYSTITSSVAIGSGSNYVTPILSTGTYTYFVGTQVCPDSVNRVAITILVDPCTELLYKEMNVQGARIFPNPANESFYIDLLSVQDCEIVLYDLTGRKTLETKVRSKEEINVSNLNPGMYFLMLKSKGFNLKEKILIK